MGKVDIRNGNQIFPRDIPPAVQIETTIMLDNHNSKSKSHCLGFHGVDHTSSIIQHGNHNNNTRSLLRCDKTNFHCSQGIHLLVLGDS